VAERLTNAPNRRTNDSPNYPWSEWADGSWWSASWGRDFVCSLSSFRALVYQTAKARGTKAETRLLKEKRIVQFRIELPEETTEPKEVTA
jgi:hypothetical protein